MTIYSTTQALIPKAKQFATRYHLSFSEIADPEAEFQLVLCERHLALHTKYFKPLVVDFLHGKNAYRQLHGGGKQQLLAKAFSLHKNKKPLIIDATAGLGTDAFQLACLQVKVMAIEQHPIIAALLQDGFDRALAAKHPACSYLKCFNQNAISWLNETAMQPDMIYLDPMYSQPNEKTQPKKSMQILRHLIGSNDDAKILGQLALSKARERVVVKRPRQAPPLMDIPVSATLTGQSTRFDIYLC